MKTKSRVIILVKAYPQPSKKHVETVCCAGITPQGEWKRLFPIRFRQLEGHQAFKRWDIVDYNYSRPTSDNRKESCKVHEESIEVVGSIKNPVEKSDLLTSALVGSEKEATENGSSLALIVPRNVKFKWKNRSESEIEDIRSSYENASRQSSFLDDPLSTLEPSPFKFWIEFTDDAGIHKKTCADRETHATFKKWRSLYGEEDALQKLKHTYEIDFPSRGMMFALGNIAKRPQIWQLLGIIRAAKSEQGALF